MNKNNKQAFTLVELIVVITILAILGTIAFISLQGYSRDARNSTRLSDMNSVESALELFSLQTGYYPDPDSFSEVTISGGVVDLWKQGELGEGVYGLISRLSHLPVDPLNGENMEYSVTDKKKEYELKYDMEISQNTRVSMSYAAQKSANITGVYNGLYLLGSDGVYYAVPSLFSDTGSLDSPADFQFTNKVTSFQVVPLIHSGVTVTSSNVKENYAAFGLGLQKAYSGSTDLNEQRFETVKNFTEASAEAYAKAIFEGTFTSTTRSTPEQNGLVTESSCQSAGWYWVHQDVRIGAISGNGFCISPRFGDWNSDSNSGNGGISWNGWGNHSGTYPGYSGWDSSSIDDSGNQYPHYGQTRRLDSNINYDCKEIGEANSDYIGSDTLIGRMQWLATTGNSYNEAASISWVVQESDMTTPIAGANGHAIPALFIADCIDGIRDLGRNDMTYTDINGNTSTITSLDYSTNVTSSTESITLTNQTYINRKKYLIGWTQKSGSHLPSAMSYIHSGYASAEDPDGDFLENEARGEYQIACEAGALADGEDRLSNEWIWLADIGHTTGESWGRTVRISWSDSCGDQAFTNTGYRGGDMAARFIIRP